MTGRTYHSNIIIIELGPTVAPIVIQHSQSRITNCTLSRRSHTISTCVGTLLALLSSCVVVTSLAST